MDEPAVMAKLFFDMILMGNSKSGGCPAEPTATGQSYWCEPSCETDNLPDQSVVSKGAPQVYLSCQRVLDSSVHDELRPVYPQHHDEPQR